MCLVILLKISNRGKRKKMKRTLITTKTILLAVLVAVLICCLAVTVALTANTQAEAEIAQPQSASDGGIATIAAATTVTDLASLTSTISTATDGTVIQLTQNITDISTPITLNKGTSLTLDLNGKSLRGNGTTSVVNVMSGTLTLIDSSTDEVASLGRIVNGVRGIVVSGGKLIMLGGRIDANRGTGINGGGVSVESGATFEMQGGVISNNIVSGAGGGVYVNKGASFKMTGGTITGNTAVNEGGGVYVGAGVTFEMSAGNIDRNNVANGNGAGLYLAGGDSDGAKFIATGGGMAYNRAGTYGGGIFSGNNTSMEITNFRIYGNYAADSGGGIYSAGDLTIHSGTTIQLNSVTNRGGGIRHRNGTLTIEDGSIITNSSSMGGAMYLESDTFIMTGGKITSNNAGSYAGVSTQESSCAISISGTAVIKSNFTTSNAASNLALGANTITINAALEDGAEIHFSKDGTGAFTSGYYTNTHLNTVKYFYSDNTSKCISYSNGDLVLNTHSLTYSATNSNNTQHWKQCEYCGEKSANENHNVTTWANADSNHSGQCTVCKATVTANHTLGAYQADEQGNHFQKCTAKGCEYETSHDAHTLNIAKSTDDTQHTGICSVCKLSVTENHTTTQRHNESGHWDECSVCNARLNEVTHDWDSLGWVKQEDNATHQATCSTCSQSMTANHSIEWTDSQGMHSSHCADCDYSTVAEAHQLEAAKSAGDSQHTGICTVCKLSVTADHVTTQKHDQSAHWDECSLCNAQTNRVEHEWDSLGWVHQDNATHKATCSACSETKTGEHVVASWSNGGSTHGGQCSLCSGTVTASHTLGEYRDDSVGKHYRQCTDCSYTTSPEAHQLDSAKSVSDSQHTGLCSVCKLSVAESHSVGAIQHNGSAHWYECSVCKTQSGYTEHNWNEIGFEQTNMTTHTSTCSDCGEKKVEEHYLVSKLQDNQYWQECKYCSFKTASTNHRVISWTKKDSSTHAGICLDCGEELIVEHNFGTTWSSNGSAHWRMCADCGETTDFGTHTLVSGTSNGNESHTGFCTGCNTQVTAGHVWSTEYSVNDNGHWRECVICSAKNNEALHVVNEWTTNGQGNHTGVCADCGATVTKAHSWGLGVCKVCSDSLFNYASKEIGWAAIAIVVELIFVIALIIIVRRRPKKAR